MRKISTIEIIKTLTVYWWNVRRKNWFIRFPFLPIPPKDWVLWRMETAWGIQANNFKWKDLPPIKIMIRDILAFGRFLTLFK
tara:strand:+ start:15 stop:260 length:246 start_codon:yes stop_codon:yes gene_type:complete